MTGTTTEAAWAKLNLSLDVLGARSDGFHDLRMVMQSVDLHDDVTVTLDDTGVCRAETNRSYLPCGADNVAVRAAQVFLARAGLKCGVHIRLHKRIPVCAGLGGGSSDAAAVLRALERLTGAGFTRAELEEMGAQVGSDVPYCVAGGTMLAEGRGERLTPVTPMPRMPVVCAVGLFNPFFDKRIVLYIGAVGVSGGVISMLTLMMKGIFCLMASFLLAATTSIEDICRALRQLHVPKVLTSLLLLTFRYISVLLDEAAIMTDAYRLRAPGQKGVHISAWGSFLGQLLLRSMDRATALYESMELRGYHGEFHYAQGRPSSRASWPFAIGCAALIVLARLYNLPALLGGLFA